MFKLLEHYIKSITEIDEPSLTMIFSKFSLIKTTRNQILVDYNETTRYFAFQGEFGTALPSLINQEPAFEYLQTIEKSELLTISRTDFYFLVDQIPQFALVYRRILEKGFIIAQKRIYGFQGFNAMEKVIWIKTHQPKFLSRISNKMAASYLGLSPSTLSRIKAKL
jgi:hypothetical protein